MTHRTEDTNSSSGVVNWIGEGGSGPNSACRSPRAPSGHRLAEDVGFCSACRKSGVDVNGSTVSSRCRRRRQGRPA
jgi:hypothetical protein